MKKKLLGGLLIVATAAVVFNVNMNTDKNELSLLALANVEVLVGDKNIFYLNDYEEMMYPISIKILNGKVVKVNILNK